MQAVKKGQATDSVSEIDILRESKVTGDEVDSIDGTRGPSSNHGFFQWSPSLSALVCLGVGVWIGLKLRR